MMKLIETKGKKPMPMNMLRCQHVGKSMTNLDQPTIDKETIQIKVFSNDQLIKGVKMKMNS